jgi:DNA-binding transcriptional ArsR family regulator
MDSDTDFAGVAALLANASRATFLRCLMDGRGHIASELARQAGVTAPTASAHLSRLLAAGLIVRERKGRHSFYKLAGPKVASAVEALGAIAPLLPVGSLKQWQTAQALRFARTCYDHLAGTIGVALTEALLRKRALTRRRDSYRLTPSGESFLVELGVDVDRARRQRRQFARPCLDWSERRPHLGGALGAAIATRLIELACLERRHSDRGLNVTAIGRARLETSFGVNLPSR